MNECGATWIEIGPTASALSWWNHDQSEKIAPLFSPICPVWRVNQGTVSNSLSRMWYPLWIRTQWDGYHFSASSLDTPASNLDKGRGQRLSEYAGNGLMPASEL